MSHDEIRHYLLVIRIPLGLAIGVTHELGGLEALV